MLVLFYLHEAFEELPLHFKQLFGVLRRIIRALGEGFVNLSPQVLNLLLEDFDFGFELFILYFSILLFMLL